MPSRVLALALAVVLLVTFATPAKAEAIEPMTALAIAGGVIIVIILVAYLVIANVEGPTMSEGDDGPRIVRRDGDLVWVAVAMPRESP